MIAFRFDIMKKLETENITAPLKPEALRSIRAGKVPNLQTIDILCGLLHCQPGDIIHYVKDK